MACRNLSTLTIVAGAERVEPHAEVVSMQVTAISTPRQPEWRWRITDYAGAVVEESHVGFPSIAAAVAAGKERLQSMNGIDHMESTPRAEPPRFRR
jgi:hypothetical protein